ncbi:hypothetical protein MTR67_016161 [Solanum verrucosum]|uniref:Uncharacterized protein n=1 Tax=Solanum verrucosum TaxID=315347 RepID=A0AAF0TKG5_SOLVR|nr:hypothetical protein MTR67_016161 [Solanum verrucosum]
MAAFLGAYKGGINNLEELQCLEHLKLLNDALFINKTLHLPLAFSILLDAVPLELADIPSLQEMRLDNTSKAVKSAKYVRDSKTSKSMKLKLSIFPPENESKVAQ